MADTQLRLEGGRFHAIGSGGWLAFRFLRAWSERPTHDRCLIPEGEESEGRETHNASDDGQRCTKNDASGRSPIDRVPHSRRNESQSGDELERRENVPHRAIREDIWSSRP